MWLDGRRAGEAPTDVSWAWPQKAMRQKGSQEPKESIRGRLHADNTRTSTIPVRSPAESASAAAPLDIAGQVEHSRARQNGGGLHRRRIKPVDRAFR